MRRIRKRWRGCELPIGVIGDVGDLTYDYEDLGAGPDTLRELADGKGAFFEVLKKAKRPLIIVGQGALARPDGAAVLGLAAKLARRRRRGLGRLERLCGPAHRRRARRRPRSGLRPGRGRARHRRHSRACSTFCSCSAPTRSTWPRRRAFVVYIGTHGDAGAHRADVILPGAAYTEKSGTYVNTEGRVQMTNRAGFPPGEAREDWAILRALSDVLGNRLPFNSLPQLRDRLYGAHPHFAGVDDVQPADPAGVAAAASLGGRLTSAPFRSPLADFYLTNPIARASAVMAECSALRQGRLPAGSRVGSHGQLLLPLRLPALIVLLKSVVLIVVLLIFVAYILYADRKIWAAVQLRRGPNVVGPWGLFQAFADLLKFVFKEPVIPAGANKGVFLLAPLVGRAGALGLGGDPGEPGLGDRQHQCRHPLCLRHLLARASTA